MQRDSTGRPENHIREKTACMLADEVSEIDGLLIDEQLFEGEGHLTATAGQESRKS